jgi:phosphoribosylformylglycinamidine synthase subunit PurQ / glutaminase
VNVRVAIVTGYGINADAELAGAFRSAGAEALPVHVQDLLDDPRPYDSCGILAFPGGFSFGDHLGSGLVLAQLLRKGLKPWLTSFVACGGLVIGVCNGFQVLVHMGLLPNLDGDWTPRVSLVHNEAGMFDDSWITMEFDPESPCVWTRGLSTLDAPIRHGEGRFVAESEETLRDLANRHLIAARYRGRNPNGSQADVAGVCDPTGRVFGLMPHAEVFLSKENHPLWTRGEAPDVLGGALFENGVRCAESTRT